VGDVRSVYVVMVCERHTDPTPYVFTDRDRAINYARSEAASYAGSASNVEEEQIDGWEYYATWPTEDDAIWVIKRKVDETQ
jgi:hypothetical protein